MNRKICLAAFAIGLSAIVWVGTGYVGVSYLALVMTSLIAAVYLAGAYELLHIHRDSSALTRALHAIADPLEQAGEWLATLPPSLQNAVRLRIEGERVGLPGPSVTPYLVGLLVLLGMLGTFLGMVVTLNGAVLALESTTDLHTIRAALTAPVKGLGVAFGTSVAGVAASAMLGLISSLLRRERQQAAQLLDAKIATALRGSSLAHQRREAFKALQLQSQTLPDVVDKLHALMTQMAHQSQQLNERLVASQEAFQRDAREMYSELAASVGQSLRESLAESARLAGEAIQPVVVATMGGIARETTLLHETLGATVDRQLLGVGERLDTAVAKVAESWNSAVERHEKSNENLNQGLQGSLVAFADSFEQRSAALLASVETAHATLRAEMAATSAQITGETGNLHRGLAAAVDQQLVALSARLDQAVGHVAATWTAALERQEASAAGLTSALNENAVALAGDFAEKSAALIAAVDTSQQAWRTELAAADEARQRALSAALTTMAETLREEWRAAGAQTLAQQEAICHTLGETARDIGATAEAQAGSTIAEVARLMQTAAEAPRAAAEVIGQLRQELSASMARDNTLLEERARIMETLGGLLAAINHASTEQRGAIDALVASATALLDRAGQQFSERMAGESARMVEVAAQVTGGAVEVASLGEAFGLAVDLFSQSNEKLMAALQRIEAALGKSLTRSDEQLAYYVAQAREIIDLSILSQKQVVEDLQQYAAHQASLVGES